jgi:hypothetical protein
MNAYRKLIYLLAGYLSVTFISQVTLRSADAQLPTEKKPVNVDVEIVRITDIPYDRIDGVNPKYLSLDILLYYMRPRWGRII